jgi:hypothetical protein
MTFRVMSLGWLYRRKAGTAQHGGILLEEGMLTE